jgi:hypothetical protein
MPLRHRTYFLLPLVACAVALPAIAQPQPALTNYPACTGKPSPSDSEAAHSAFLLGKRFFDEADYGSAIHNFVDAYKLDCTKTELLTIIARANELSGNKAEAVHALETYLTRAPNLGPDDKNQIQKRIDNLKAQMASQAPASASVAPVPVPTPVVTTAPPPPTQTAPLPPPPPSEERHHSAVPWAFVGVGGALFVAGGITWLIGHSKYTTALSDCMNMPNSCTDQMAVNSGSTGHTMMLAGGGLFIGGGVIAAGGLIWHFVEPTGPADTTTKAAVRPELGPGYAGVSGRF